MKTMAQQKIWLSAPHLSGKELKYITDFFEISHNTTLSANIDNFERDLCAFTGVQHAAALSSGTAAIHLALILLGIRAKDEVICSSLTFSATCNPIIYQGATPIFIDSESLTWNMSPTLLEDAIKNRIAKNKKPKAIIVVHLYGMPAQIETIMTIAKHYDIPVIEDAAEAFGSTYKGKTLGTFGEIGIFSFNNNKIITTFGGGALVSNDDHIVRQSRFLATQARDNAPHYQHSQIGYNYRMSNILAGIGRGQMEVVNDRIWQRRKKFEFYQTHLSDIESISFLEEPNPTYISNRWLTCIKLQTFAQRECIRLALEKKNIESRPIWKPMQLQPVFEKYPFYGNGISEKLFTTGLCLPSSSDLDTASLNVIVSIIRKSLQ